MERILSFGMGTNRSTEISKKLVVEYEKIHGIDEANNTEDFSLVFTASFHANRTKRKILDKRKRRLASSQIKRYTTLNPSLANMIKERVLIGPLSVETHIHVEKAGLDFFHTLPLGKINALFKKTCSYVRGPLRRRICYKRIKRRYLSYREKLDASGMMDLKRLRLFMQYYFKRLSHKDQLTALFGNENVFIQGQLSAYTADKVPFQTFFRSGQFKNLGVIDKFMNQDRRILE